MHDLVAGPSPALQSPKWRDRHSGVLALSEALTGRTWEEMRGLVAVVWRETLKVLDDSRDSVRQGAAKLAKSLLLLTGRLVEHGEVSARPKIDIRMEADVGFEDAGQASMRDRLITLR